MKREVVIIGAGPAGMRAAIALCEAGLEPTVVDENPRTGGQIYRQPSAGLSDQGRGASSALNPQGKALFDAFARYRGRIELLTDTRVWGIFPPRRLAMQSAGGWTMIEAEQLILATGAYEYVPPFPGWTLPGVMTPGGMQTLVKSTRVSPGQRVLIGGSGPFLLVVARQLHSAGVNVVGIVEMSRRREWIRHFPRLLSDWTLLNEGRSYLRTLRHAGIPIHWGHVVTEVRGGEAMTQAVIAPCTGDGTPDHDRARIVEADALGIGYGFVSRTELAQLTGCGLYYADERGGWIPALDECLQTSAPGVWAAGDGAGVAGALVAELEGHLVGNWVAASLGRLHQNTVHDRCRNAVGRLKKLRRFRTALDRIYRIRPGLSQLATPDTIVCRCEELTRAEIDEGIEYGGTEMRSLKVITRLGMGPCQGCMCWPATARRIAQRTGKGMESIGPRRVRPPTQRLCMSDLVCAQVEVKAAAAAAGRH